ncbi:hypothetical protein SDC9_118816 [bioreactor metagenome]|uniref:Uncharacterized protein n=1 Tax=bioreactor metagenome TaxID=1076179 RepID=A0A645C2T6_9ZZZZ
MIIARQHDLKPAQHDPFAQHSDHRHQVSRQQHHQPPMLAPITIDDAVYPDQRQEPERQMIEQPHMVRSPRPQPENPIGPRQRQNDDQRKRRDHELPRKIRFCIGLKQQDRNGKRRCDHRQIIGRMEHIDQNTLARHRQARKHQSGRIPHFQHREFPQHQNQRQRNQNHRQRRQRIANHARHQPDNTQNRRQRIDQYRRPALAGVMGVENSVVKMRTVGRHDFPP